MSIFQADFSMVSHRSRRGDKGARLEDNVAAAKARILEADFSKYSILGSPNKRKSDPSNRLRKAQRDLGMI